MFQNHRLHLHTILAGGKYPFTSKMDLALSERQKKKQLMASASKSYCTVIHSATRGRAYQSNPIKMIIHQEILTFARVRPILTGVGGGTSVNPGFLGSCNTFCYPRQLAHGLGELGHQKKRSKSSNLNIL